MKNFAHAIGRISILNGVTPWTLLGFAKDDELSLKKGER